jgi:hypothetical protein
VAEFDDLNSKIKMKHAAFEQKRLSRENRKREIGASYPFKLSQTDRFLMLLMHYHFYPNNVFSKERVVVEHTFSRLRNFRIWVDEFRNCLKHYDKVIDIVCGLVNFRIMGILII